MVPTANWVSTRWGIRDEPGDDYVKEMQAYVSIMTKETDMNVYRNRAYGLVFHITSSYNFWEYFQVIGSGRKRGNIVGGPGDGGSHTPGHRSWRKSPKSMGKDYAWFTEQKEKILENYNTVYGTHDYNEFIVNGLSPQALAGVLHNTRGSKHAPTDREFCNFLCWRAGIGSWPMYAYTRWSRKLEIERYLDCTPDLLLDGEYGCNK